MQGSIEIVVSVLACAGQVAVGLWAASLSRRVTMAGPLALLCAAFSTWTLASLLHSLLGREGPWHYVDVAVSPIIPMLALRFVLVYVGRRPNPIELAVTAGAVVLSAVSGAAGFFEPLRSFERSRLWELSFLAVAFPAVVAALTRLVVYALGTVGAAEQRRTQLLISALAAAFVFAMTEIAADLGYGVPRLGHVGGLTTAVLLGFVALGTPGFRGRRVVFYAALPLSFLLVVAAVRSVAAGLATAVGATVVPGLLVLLAFGWPLTQWTLESRAQRRRLAFMGRLVDQIAHDIRNPVSAIKGGAQFLLTELDEERPLAPHRSILEMVDREASRLARSVSIYRRLGRLELDRSVVDLSRIAERALETISWPEAIRVERDLESCVASVDADLAQIAIENIATNARDAMPDGGRVRVSALDGDVARVIVEDEGHGIDLRARRAIFRDFYTTKPSGSGLGLPFVQRVMDAHGGHVTLGAGEARGLRVTLHFPKR